MPSKPGSKGFESDDTKFQPAKLSDRKREGQANEIKSYLDDGNTYGMGNKFALSDKVTKPGGGYQGYDGEMFNDSDKNSNLSRLKLINKQTANCGTAYNGYPIPEVYTPATSHGEPDANAVCYKEIEKDRNP